MDHFEIKQQFENLKIFIDSLGEAQDNDYKKILKKIEHCFYCVYNNNTLIQDEKYIYYKNLIEYTTYKYCIFYEAYDVLRTYIDDAKIVYKKIFNEIIIYCNNNNDYKGMYQILTRTELFFWLIHTDRYKYYGDNFDYDYFNTFSSRLMNDLLNYSLDIYTKDVEHIDIFNMCWTQYFVVYTKSIEKVKPIFKKKQNKFYYYSYYTIATLYRMNNEYENAIMFLKQGELFLKKNTSEKERLENYINDYFNHYGLLLECVKEISSKKYIQEKINYFLKIPSMELFDEIKILLRNDIQQKKIINTIFSRIVKKNEYCKSSLIASQYLSFFIHMRRYDLLFAYIKNNFSYFDSCVFSCYCDDIIKYHFLNPKLAYIFLKKCLTYIEKKEKKMLIKNICIYINKKYNLF
jgi:hypothetical protein